MIGARACRSSTASPLLCGALAATIALAILGLGPPGADLAAHLYQRGLFLEHGFSVWNNFWYAGRYSFVTYSVLYYPLAAVLGIPLLAVISAAGAAGTFSLLVDRQWGRAARPASLVFAAATGVSVVAAAFPYALGLATALIALLALQRRRSSAFALMVVLTFAASPLAFLLLAVVLAAAALAHSVRDLARPGLVVGLTALAAVALWRLFPDGGHYPFPASELAGALVFCLVGLLFTWRLEVTRLLRSLFAVYAAVCVLSYLIASPLGENVIRLRFVALPLAVLTLSLRQWRPLLPGLAAIALACSWNLTPLAASFGRGTDDPSASPAYWRSTIAYLRLRLDPSYRVEVVDTTGHWGALYLPAAGIPIVRGWFRQDDWPQNAVLYRHPTARSYTNWLRRLGVKYVVLTSAPDDYSARAEARLLRSGRAELPAVFRAPTATIFVVPSPRPIITGPGRGRVLALTHDTILVRVAKPGTYRLAVRHNPYWTSTRGCITQGADGMIKLTAQRVGLIEIRFHLTLGRALAAIAARPPTCDVARKQA